MNNTELNQLIASFKGYRDLLVPIQKNLGDFMGTYDAMRENIEKLNSSFAGDLKAKIEDLFNEMALQAGKANNLSGQIDKLAGSAAKYTTEVGAFVARFAKIEERLAAILELEKRAEQQIDRLDTLLQEKSKNYNLKELQTALDKYNDEIKKVSSFVNKDVGSIITESADSLASMKGGIDALVASRGEEKDTLKSLLASYKTTGDYLKKITEGNDINEAYMFEVLDKWAQHRGVKTKHK